MNDSRCAECGRPLRTSPGPYGPVCARRRTAPAPRRPAPGTANDPLLHCEGQTALPLHPHQPTLWSL